MSSSRAYEIRIIPSLIAFRAIINNIDMERWQALDLILTFMKHLLPGQPFCLQSHVPAKVMQQLFTDIKYGSLRHGGPARTQGGFLPGGHFQREAEEGMAYAEENSLPR